MSKRLFFIPTVSNFYLSLHKYWYMCADLLIDLFIIVFIAKGPYVAGTACCAHLCFGYPSNITNVSGHFFSAITGLIGIFLEVGWALVVCLIYNCVNMFVIFVKFQIKKCDKPYRKFGC